MQLRAWTRLLLALNISYFQFINPNMDMSLPLVIYISTRQVMDALGVFPPRHFKPTTVNNKTIVCIHFYLCTLALYLHLIVASLYVQHLKHNYKKFKFFL